MSKNILIIDSSQSFTKYIEVVLSRLEYSSMTARSARDGLQILKGRIPDLVITEAVLPDMNGIELCRNIRESSRTRRIPILVVTVDSKLDERFGTDLKLYDEVLVKPVSVRDLFDILQKLLDRKQLRHNLRAPLAARVSCRDGTQYRSYVTLNVGEGGMFIESDKPRPAGETIETELLLPGIDDPLPLKGQIVFAVEQERGKHPQGMGIKFIDMDPQVRIVLANYMENYLTDSLSGE